MYAQFISTEYIFKWTVIPNNVDTDLVTKFIRQAQDMNIQQVLGHDLYFKLMNDYATSGTTTGKYLELMQNYIMPAQAEWTVYHSLPFIWARISNKSLVKKESDNSTPTELHEMQFIREQARNNAEYYTQRITEFIMNNQNSFPEYWTTTGCDRIRPKRNNYSSGFYTGKSMGY